MTSTLNGRLPRKQLADQLDRFDSILDGLSDALNEAVADAAREGAKAAVREVLNELLQNPPMAHLGSALQTPIPQTDPPVQRPSWLSRIKLAIECMWRGIQATATTVKNQVSRVIPPLKTVVDVMRWSGKLKKSLWIASGIGVAVGTITAICPHWVATMTSSVAATVTAFTVQTGFMFKNLIHRFRLS